MSVHLSHLESRSQTVVVRVHIDVQLATLVKSISQLYCLLIAKADHPPHGNFMCRSTPTVPGYSDWYQITRFMSKVKSI